MHIGVLPVCIPVCHMCAWCLQPEEVIRAPEIRVADGYELLCGSLDFETQCSGRATSARTCWAISSASNDRILLKKLLGYNVKILNKKLTKEAS